MQNGDMHDYHALLDGRVKTEDPFIRRQRERREAEEAEERREAREVQRQAQRLAAQRSEFRNSFYGELEPVLDAIGQIVDQLRGEFEPKIEALENRIAALENQLSLNGRFDELERSLAARQSALIEAKRGPTGRQGGRGARGEVGPRGATGPKGEPGLAAQTTTAWKIDHQRFRVVPLMSDGRFGVPIELRSLFEEYLRQTGGD